MLAVNDEDVHPEYQQILPSIFQRRQKVLAVLPVPIKRAENTKRAWYTCLESSVFTGCRLHRTVIVLNDALATCAHKSLLRHHIGCRSMLSSAIFGQGGQRAGDATCEAWLSASQQYWTATDGHAGCAHGHLRRRPAAITGFCPAMARLAAKVTPRGSPATTSKIAIRDTGLAEL